jgi:hypothetical protein
MMSEKIEVAVIAALVALITALISALVAWRQLKSNREKWREEVSLEQERWKREIEHKQVMWKQEVERERSKWLSEQKANYDIELYKVRLTAYPDILKVIGELSTRAPEPLTAEKAKQVANQINAWLYSAGGLYASKQTRGALLGLREVLLSWGTKQDWGQLYGFRNPAIQLLRRDIDVKGLESYDFNNLQSLLEELNQEVSSIK